MISEPAEIEGRCNCFALRRASRYLTAAYDKALAPVDLRITQFTILQKLAGRGEMTITRLAELIVMDRTTLATNLKPLARDGLVTVEQSAADRRVRLASVTPAGIARLRAGIPLWEAAQARFEGRFGDENAERLRGTLDAVLTTGLEPWS